MKVVIDTNVLLTALYPRSKNYWIRKALEKQQIILCVTTDILDEYFEVFSDYYDPTSAELFMSAIEVLPNILFIKKYYFWHLIPEDQDDEKFVDCAIAVGADYLVTNDKHFRHLKSLEFPKINILDEDEFYKIFHAKHATP